MEIIVGKSAGFCNGVASAVAGATQLLAQKDKVYALGNLAHNNNVMASLKAKGLVVVEELDNLKPGDSLIIRAHGITKAMYEQAAAAKVEILDLTCPKVLAIHEIAAKYAKADYFIILIGQKEHAEVVGSASFCGNDYALVETEEDIAVAVSKIRQSQKNQVLLISQTTFNLELFNQFEAALRHRLKELDITFEVINTICDATRTRQEETKEIAQLVEAMIIIGGKHSSNTQKLYDIAKASTAYAVHIETKDELDLQKIKAFKKVGIMAGASTPKISIDELVTLLKTIN